MAKRLAIVIAVLLCCTLTFTGCSNPMATIREFFNKNTDTAQTNESSDQDALSLSEVSAVQPENTRPTVMYYKDNENLLVPVMRYIPKGDLGLAKSALSSLIYSPEKADDLKAAGLLPTLPSGTEIKGVVIKDNGVAVVDLSEQFLSFSSPKAEEIGVKALVYTMTEFPNVTAVELRVEGKNIDAMPQGTKIGTLLKRTEINLQSVQNKGDKLSKVMVYYQKKGSGSYAYFVPVTKLVAGYKNSAEAALNALIQGPGEGTNLQNPFPQGTQLLGVQVKDGVAYVNLSDAVFNTQGSKAAEKAMVKAVSLTLKQFSVIDKVKIFINGKTLENSEGIGADQYLDVPVFVNFYE